jgi:hypothetical protein
MSNYSKRVFKLLMVIPILFGLSGCIEKRVIVVKEPPKARPHVTHSNTRPVQEEVLVGRNNQNLGRRVDEVNVPRNHPSLGVKVPNNRRSHREEPTENGLNGQTIERMPFPVSEYNRLKKIGNSTVHGKIYLINTENDKEIIGKKVKLYLNPVTSYSRQWYQYSYLEGYKLTQPDKRLYNYLRSTYSDEKGTFSFFGVPRGRYYLIGRIECANECGYSSNKIIRLAKEIYVDSGTNNVELTKVVP